MGTMGEVRAVSTTQKWGQNKKKNFRKGLKKSVVKILFWKGLSNLSLGVFTYKGMTNPSKKGEVQKWVQWVRSEPLARPKNGVKIKKNF